MKDEVSYAIIGILTAITLKATSLELFSLDIYDWLWWTILVIMNTIGVKLYYKYIQKTEW